ncbi:MAG: phosphoribosylamine--glycine ligase [Clostridia bacterium]|jgi:phosphoribosylamine--glycine ligase|nr:phosphoribosylamine--glycine ligase [Clostridia bacterium]
MKVLVIGSGAREHAIVWKLSQSPKISKLFCAPGNAGIADLAECVDIKAEDIDGMLRFALENKIDLTVVGPEIALVKGVVDLFEQNGLRIFGPNKKAAQLEGSKIFAKDFMKKYKIPTARYKTYNNFEKAIAELKDFDLPMVIKADGLAAGKGVIIAQTRQEAVEAIFDIMGDMKFGEAGKTIVVEEFLQGKEVSVLAFVDGNMSIPMVSAQDYKRAQDGDKGLNTGGMGAVSPALHYSLEVEKLVNKNIIYNTIQALKAEGISYKGVLYFGLMLTKDGPKVLEFNVRFGDPETEVLLTRLQSDLLNIICSVVDGELNQADIKWSQEKAVCVVMASGGYPEQYEIGCEIMGIETAEAEAKIFHAGTKLIDNKLVTAGGRVLVISALGSDYEAARAKAYTAAEKLSFQDMHYRKDIGIN